MVKIEISEKELRHKLIDEIQKLDKDRLLEIYHFISRSFANELIHKVADNEDSGDIDSPKINRLIKDHRERNPYR